MMLLKYNDDYIEKQFKLTNQNISNTLGVIVKEYTEIAIDKQHLIYSEKDYKGYVLLYILQGQGTVFFDGEFYGLKKNDLMLLQLNEPFYISSHNWHFVYVHLEGNNLEHILGETKMYSIQNHATFERELFQLGDDTVINNELAILSKLFSVLEQILTKESSMYNPKSYQNEITQAVDYIEQNFQRKLKVEEIASKVGFSKFHFIRVFKEKMDKTPYQYLLEVRLNHAKFLLTHSQKSIQEITTESGFQSEVNFDYTFKKEIGVTPTHYRKREL